MCSGLYLFKIPQLGEAFVGSKNLPTSQSISSFSPKYVFNSSVNKDSEVMLWHYRLGHPNFLYLERLFPHLFINKNSKFFHCEICQLAKHTRHVYPSIQYEPSNPFSIIHSDIWGPSRVKNINGARWFISFIDDHTRTTWTFLMREKSETREIFKSFYSMILTQFKCKIQVLKTDNGREYFTSILGSYLLEQGVIHVSSCVDTPQQNGVAERKNRHLLEVARSLMFTNHVPKHFWGEAILTATYLINRMPSRVLKFQRPRQVLLQAFPHAKSFSSNLPLRIFGCSSFVHIHQQNRSKLDPKSLKCIFLGYSSHQKGYKCYSPVTKKTYNSMDVTFFEHQSYFPKPAIQGENSREFQLWDILGDTQSVYISPQSVNPTSLPSSESSNPSEPSNPSLRSTSGSLSESQFHEPSNIPNHTNDLTESTQPQLGTNCQELRVYSRRRRPNEHLENITQVRDC